MVMFTDDQIRKILTKNTKDFFGVLIFVCQFFWFRRPSVRNFFLRPNICPRARNKSAHFFPNQREPLPEL